jgi:hypothetical protein
MNSEKIMQHLTNTAYIRTGGSQEELTCAKYLVSAVQELGGTATIEPFPVDMADIEVAELLVDGVSIPCKGYRNAGSSTVEAPLYYLRNVDRYSLSQCKGKIVMIDGYLSYWTYQDLLENGAIGFITYSGDANYVDEEIDQRELRSYVSNGRKIPGVNINAKSAIRLIRDGASQAKITLKQNEYQGESRNVVLDLPGEVPEYIVLTAHYDSTALSQGAYDNMSGSLGILGIAEHFLTHPHRYGLRFIWCGSEERGLLGSKAYVRDHKEELSNVVLNINLDMIGCIMGKFISCSTAEQKMVDYISYFALEQGFGMESSQGVYSSDSTPFADAGVPAISFARAASHNTATIHNSYDTMAVMSGRQMVEDIAFLTAFTERMANAAQCPVERTMPDNMKEELDYYLTRKRRPKK